MLLGNKQMGGNTDTIYKYIRLVILDATYNPTTSYIGIDYWLIHDELNQTGNNTPTALTSNTSAVGVIASAGFTYSSSYAPWNAFDRDATGQMWWSLGGSVATDNWLQLYYVDGINIPIVSMKIRARFAQATDLKIRILASGTGNFSGEETILATLAGFLTGGPYSKFLINIGTNSIDYGIPE